MPGRARRTRAKTVVDSARWAAYEALRAIDTDDAYLNLALPQVLSARRLGGRDAAFAVELANGTTRMRRTYDALIDVVADTGTAELQPAVRTALRLGCHQLLSMRVATHAAVATSVELVRADVGERPVRLVNAVLRRIGSRDLDAWLTDVVSSDADPIDALEVRRSHPRWIIEAFGAALDADGARAASSLDDLLAADNQPPTVALVARPGLTSLDDLLAAGAVPGRWSPYAGLLAGGGDPASVPQVRRGTAGVQDEGSQLGALALARASVSGPDHRWLDLCAGPGGKAALLAGLARQQSATLLAAELHPHRAALVASALRGYGTPPAVVVCDARRAPWPDASFDRVLADVPCSGLGALRRRPDARWRRRPEEIPVLATLQRELLKSALDAVRVGGVVAYVTCSPHIAETRDVVDVVLADRPDVREEDAGALLAGVPLTGRGPHVQLWPHSHGTDAMFISVLRRSGVGSPRTRLPDR